MGQRIKALEDTNRLLEVELKLASKGRSYIVLELWRRSNANSVRVCLKNRGIVLREFNVDRIKFRGTKGPTIEPIPLARKMAFSLPQRKEIRPHKPEDGADTISQMDFLELKDLPSNYILSFGKGLWVSVTEKPTGLISGFTHSFRSILLHIRYSLTIVWNHILKKEFTIVEMMVDKEDAQALYWSLDEGTSIVMMERHPETPSEKTGPVSLLPYRWKGAKA